MSRGSNRLAIRCMDLKLLLAVYKYLWRAILGGKLGISLNCIMYQESLRLYFFVRHRATFPSQFKDSRRDYGEARPNAIGPRDELGYSRLVEIKQNGGCHSSIQLYANEC